MRKYNNKTKRTMLIIGVIFVIFIVIFSLFLKRYNEVKKTAYKIALSSILFDKELNKITTTKEATLKMKWAGDYYLNYEEKNYNLGKHSVVYNSNNGDISLYGKYYQVNKNGKVNNIKGENIIKSSVNSKFYKLEDRKYLIIDRTIEAVDSSIVTSNYLLINIDKSGNATLLNDKISLKTITPTKLRTSSYTFDIANELINFGGEDIDLKKIIGSTNEYDKDKYDLNADNKDTNTTGSGSGSGSGGGNGSGSGSGSGTGGGNGSGSGGGSGTGGGNGNGGGSGTGSGTGTGTGTGGGTGNGTTPENSSSYVNSYSSQVSDSAVDEIIKATKNTSVIRITPNITSISIDYVVYDPDNDYKSVYVEVENTNTGLTNVVYLSKTDTNIVINNLTPNVYYNLTFKYSYRENGTNKEKVFDTFGTHTAVPQMYLTVTKVVDNKIYYKINLNDSYNIVGGTINLLINGQIIKNASIPVKGKTNEISGQDCYFDITDLNLKKNQNTVITLKVVSINFNTYSVNPNISYKFRY